MNAETLKRVSKTLSYVLRHRPDSIGIELERGGWVEVDRLLLALAKHGRSYARLLLEEVVATNDKQRFEFSEDGQRIRARQGHSVEVELDYEPAVPPTMLYHGTATRFIDSIFEQGLLRGTRQHVHLSTDKATMLAVARRHGKPALLAIDAGAMQRDGYEFFVTGNHVWLTEHVPVQYLQRLE